MPLKQTRVER
jgi:hypothetical protein